MALKKVKYNPFDQSVKNAKKVMQRKNSSQYFATLKDVENKKENDRNAQNVKDSSQPSKLKKVENLSSSWMAN
jgi:hypothetical protein